MCLSFKLLWQSTEQQADGSVGVSVGARRGGSSLTWTAKVGKENNDETHDGRAFYDRIERRIDCPAIIPSGHSAPRRAAERPVEHQIYDKTRKPQNCEHFCHK